MLGRLIAKRLALSIIQLFGASIVIFALVRQLPGDPAVSQLGSTAGPEQIEALRERLHLNDPVPVQYGIWIRDLFRGDLGRSNVTGNAVTTDLADRIPATLELITHLTAGGTGRCSCHSGSSPPGWRSAGTAVP